MCIIPASLVSAVGYVQTYSWERAAGLQSVHLGALGSGVPRTALSVPAVLRHRSGPAPLWERPPHAAGEAAVLFLAGPLGGVKECPCSSSLASPISSPSRPESPSPPPFPPLLFLRFSPFPSLFLSPLPFPSFLFFVCRTENTAVTFPPSEAQYDHSMNSSLSLYFLSCLVNDMYFSCYLYT